ncbi:MAG: UDP-N-acetylmuramoyl-L-alanine--D-glutamate ligase [Candidatus Omnitrophica bacterium]|nr:UDP-N-acetylmuramoyl-L-alanine--D-glutamate ligase [Candidatus Omnitrophota bacterium]
MRNTAYFKDKQVTIVGLARSGVACANLLRGLDASVRVTDIKDNAQTRSNAALLSQDIQVELGKHSEDFIKGADLVVISPGVPGSSQPAIWAKDHAKPVISEIEIAAMLCPGRIIAVTGSNGKTTVTTLIGRVLEASGKKVFVCGNIGNPFSGEVARIGEGDFAVVEVSSFQLETIKDFKPKIALILNINPNHLDRYNKMREYLDAKKRIFMNQDKDDFLILNSQEPGLSGLEKEASSKTIFFSREDGLNPNQSAVLKAGELLGLDRPTMLKVFSDFKGIEHRMEDVAEINKIKFINDSKATTADSAIWALNSISSPVVLLAGGRHKGIDYRVIIDAARNKVKQVVLIGEAKDKIADCLKGEFPVEMAASLEDAVNKTYTLAKPGYSVLFSPMCSSFDMFTDYEERGRAFKKIVLELAKRKTESPANNEHIG